MERGSDKHSPRLDDELEREDQTITRSGQPPHTEESRETEPFEEPLLDEELPADEAPGTPARADIARLVNRRGPATPPLCRDDVRSKTGGQQEPFTYGSLPAEAMYFKAAGN